MMDIVKTKIKNKQKINKNKQSNATTIMCRVLSPGKSSRRIYNFDYFLYF